jgi:rhodanese-related sulfurtransferase
LKFELTEEMFRMKRFCTSVLLTLLTASVLIAAPARDISSTEAKAIIDKNRNVFVLDVRFPQERAQGYIPGSVLIPIDRVEKRLNEVPRNRPVVVYCAVGSRSRIVAQALSGMGYPEVYNMRDGITGWYRNGFPIQR